MTFRHNVLRLGCICTIALAIFAAFVSASPGAYAAGPVFTDLPENDSSYPFVNYLVKINLIRGCPDGSFHPAGTLTRAETAAMLARAGKLDGQAPATQTYSDIGPEHWAYTVIEGASRAGLLKGYPDGSFRPEAPVTRAEACVLLLRLTNMPVPSDITLSDTIKDVQPAHWARRQIAVALQAGLFTVAQKNNFAPEARATRAQLARGLAILLNIDPGRIKVPLDGTLVPLKGKTTVRRPGQTPQEIVAPIAIGVGATIETGPDSQAEINFSDGSGLKLDAATTLTIKEARGQSTILKDGTPGTVIEYLKLDLARGRIFGALAVTYINKHQTPGKLVSQSTSQGFKPIELACASPGLSAGLILAEAEAEEQDIQWWQAAFEEKVRVEVDMPWSVATVRGTFWMNEVGPGFNLTSVADGEVEVSSNWHSVSVPAGQATFVNSPSAPPSPPVAMTPAQLQIWEGVKGWIQERAAIIERTAPVINPTVLGWQPGQHYAQSIAASIIQAIYSVISGTTQVNQSNMITQGGGGSGGNNVNIPQVYNGVLQFSEATYTVDESGGSAVITVVRINGSDGEVTVAYETADGSATAGSDYTTAGGILTFNSGEKIKTFTVAITDDSDYELDETIYLTLSNPGGGACLGTPVTAVLTITGNDSPQAGVLQFSSATYTVTENSGSAVITVNRSGGSDGVVSVVYETADGSATAGSDYTTAIGTLIFNSGETSKTFTVAITDDGTNEGDETVNLSLSSPGGGANLGTLSTAVLTIADIMHFVDNNLEATVCTALNITGDITYTDMLGLTTLNAANKGIQNLSGLEYAINLQGLDLSHNNIHDISALVANSGLSVGDYVYLDYNYLDLDTDSQTWSDIQTLINRGVNVTYGSQSNYSQVITVVPSTTTPTQGVAFSLLIENARGTFNSLLTGNFKVKVTSDNNSEGPGGIVFHNWVNFNNGVGVVPVTLTQTGSQTLTLKITSVSQNRPTVNVTVQSIP